MKKLYLISTAFLVANCLSSCKSSQNEKTTDSQLSSPGFDMKRERSFIDSMGAKFTEEFRNGDSAALASHYSSDAEMLFPNHEPIKGKDILSTWGSYIRGGIKNSTRDLRFITSDLTGDIEFMIETGTYEMRDDKKTIQDKGRYVVVWKKENGQWKLYRDIGN